MSAKAEKKERSLEPVYHDDGSVTVPLEYPIEDITKEIIDEVKLTRPKAKQMKKIGTNVTMENLMMIASDVSGIHPKDMDKLDAADLMAVTGVIADFLERGRKTGQAQ